MEDIIIEGDSSTTEETVTDNSDIDVDKLLETNKKLYARLKEAEEKAKRVKELEDELKKTQETPKAPETTPGLTKEEVILFSKGFSIDEVEKLKTISSLENTGLLVAAESDVFKAYKAAQDAKKKDEESELEISKGSPKVRKQIDFKSPDLTPEQHRELFKKRFGI